MSQSGPYYLGRGKRAREDIELPTVNPEAMREPSGYLADRGLASAVDVALTLGMPLLLTGEPGCGKSQLAYSVAYELRLGDPQVFSVKSDTRGQDLFYEFDTVGRFHAASTTDADADPLRYISFNALGSAIILARSRDAALQSLGIEDATSRRGKLALAALGVDADEDAFSSRSVVLIDEIDKAPRDVPNDILVEIEDMKFRIPELSAQQRGEVVVSLADHGDAVSHSMRPIVFITSNSEKALPEAFLRRCVYCHVPFPCFKLDKENDGTRSGAVTVESIVESRLGDRYMGQTSEPLVGEALALFRELRDERRGLKRPPSIAELLNWVDLLLHLLQRMPSPPASLASMDTLRNAVKSTLLKEVPDHKRADTLIQECFDAIERRFG